MSLSLTDFDPNAKIDPAITLSGVVMSYLEVEPPYYRMVRLKVQELFERTVLNPEYYIIYQSPKIVDPRDARMIFLAEKHHHNACCKANARLVDTLIEPNSLFLAESLKFDQEITGSVREFNLEEYRISEYARNYLTLYGWDSLDDFRELYAAYTERREPELTMLDADGRPTAFGLHATLARHFHNEPEYSIDNTCLFMDAIEERSAEEFPERTFTMVQTLETLPFRYPGRTFCVAGFEHFSQQKLHLKKKSLAPLYQFLKTAPALVLCPVVIKKDIESVFTETTSVQFWKDMKKALKADHSISALQAALGAKPFPAGLRPLYLSS